MLVVPWEVLKKGRQSGYRIKCPRKPLNKLLECSRLRLSQARFQQRIAVVPDLFRCSLGVSALPAPCRVVHSSHTICVEWRALPELTFIAGFSYTRLQPSSETTLVSMHTVLLLVIALSGYHILL